MVFPRVKGQQLRHETAMAGPHETPQIICSLGHNIPLLTEYPPIHSISTY